MTRRTEKIIAAAAVIAVLAGGWIMKRASDREFEESLKRSSQQSADIRAAMQKEFDAELEAIRTGAHGRTD